MIYSETSWEDFRYLIHVLDLPREKIFWWPLHPDNVFPFKGYSEGFLFHAEEHAGALLDNGRELNPEIDYRRMQRILFKFYFDRLEDIRYGLDYNVELRSREQMVNEDTFPSLYRYLVTIPGDKGYGLERENHNFGYHIHYVQYNGKRAQRTNSIFMFNPKEPMVPKPVLFWEPHHETAQVQINPGGFGNRRRMSIYDTCTPFLEKIPKQEFKDPSKNASKFHPLLPKKNNNLL